MPAPQTLKQEIIGLYDRAAPIYDQVGTQQFKYFGRMLIERLAIPAGGQVLDIACGRGALLLPAAEKVGASGHVIGIDLAPTMVEETGAEIERRGLQQAEVRLADADEIAFKEGAFDTITCGFALHFLDYERLLPRLLHYLKPGGCFAAIAPYTPVHDEENLARWKWLFELTKAAFPPDFVPPPAWIAPRKFGTPELAEAAFKQAGFTDVRIEAHEATLYFKDEADWWNWEWSQGSRFWVEGMSAEARERFHRESYKHLRHIQTAQGIPMLNGALFVFGYKNGE
ncbi:MAG: methyltransferase domain-containing protein [Anaerolineae bacterium]